MARKPIEAFVLIFALSSWATAQQFEWFDLSAFDPELVETDMGQIFHDACENLDMLATGTFAGTLEVGMHDVVSVNDFMQSTCFTFDFESDVDLYVRVESLDDEEVLKIGSYGDIEYVHEAGALPEIAYMEGVDNQMAEVPPRPDGNPNMMLLTGDGLGFGPDGASRGYIHLGITDTFGWCYSAQADQKSEALSIGKLVVPEPRLTWVIPAVLVAFLQRRRSTRRS